MSKDLDRRIEALERRMGFDLPPAPRIHVGFDYPDGRPNTIDATNSVRVSGRQVEREPGESSGDFIERINEVVDEAIGPSAPFMMVWFDDEPPRELRGNREEGL